MASARKPRGKILTRLRLRKPPKKPSKGDHAILSKRAHRQTLAGRAEAHWKERGTFEQSAYMAKVLYALRAEGFRSTPFQWRHKGQLYGLVKDLGERQIHVRIYENGVIDAEVEIHARYVQHLYSKRPSAHRAIQRIFSKHGIPVDFINEHYLPQVGAARKRYPRGRTRVSHLIGGVGAVAGVVLVSVVRLKVQRRRWWK